MKHIFMGVIETKFYYLSYNYKINGKYDAIDNCFNRKSILNMNDFYKICNDIEKLYIKTIIDISDYKMIKESTDIQERILEHSKVKINDEELYIEEVVQCDNGDVVCYTNKILKTIDDEESKKVANELIIKCQDELDKQKQENNKKWWKFWK
mgnify:CR=1 FL=1